MPARRSVLVRRTLRTLAAIVASSMIFVLIAATAPAATAAQTGRLPGVDDDTYESPTYGYALAWDGRDWEAVDATSDEDDGDTLVLTNEVSTLYITGTAAYDGDARECSFDMGEIVASPDAYETYPSESGDRDLDPEDYSYLVDCRELVEGEAVLIIVHVFPATDLGAELVEAQAVTETLVIDEESESQAGNEDDLEAAGVDGNVYESPEWGYTVEWDEDVWEVRDASVSTRANFLNLINEGSSLIISGIAELGDVESCLETATEFYSTDDGVENWEVLEDEDGDPIERSTRRRAYGAYVYSAPDDSGQEIDYVNYIECRPLDDEAGMMISHLTTLDDYDDQSELREELLESLEVP